MIGPAMRPVLWLAERRFIHQHNIQSIFTFTQLFRELVRLLKPKPKRQVHSNTHIIFPFYPSFYWCIHSFIIRPSIHQFLRWPARWPVYCICCVGLWGPEGGLWWRRTGSRWNCRQEERRSPLSGEQQGEKQIRLHFVWLVKIRILFFLKTKQNKHTGVFACFSTFTINL